MKLKMNRIVTSIIAIMLVVAMIAGNCNIFGSGLALAAETDATATTDATTIDADTAYQEGYQSCVDLEAEGAVLLKNANNTLPLSEGTKVTILGSMSYNYVEGGTGSAGGKDDENTVMMSDAFIEAGLDVNPDAWSWLETQCGGARGVDASDPAGVGWTKYDKIHEFASNVYESGKSSIVKDGYTDYVIVTFARSGAEGASPSMDYDGDGSTLTGSTYLQLDQNEKDLLAYCKANFKNTIVLINSATPMELGFIDSTDYNVGACIWMGHPGEAGVVGVGTILTGRTNPSGRLVDTYAYDMTTNPTYYNTDNNKYTDQQTFYQYEEGIYMGYRYFETADSVGYFDSTDFTSLKFKNGSASGYNQVVQFPFGYGLSYTTYKEEIKNKDIKLKAHGTNSVTVNVTNTGSVAGKDVVELYMEAPYQSDTNNFGIQGKGLEKSRVVLVGFAKTDVIDPGKSAEVTITFQTDNLASYDNFGQGCYVLEKGDYKFNVQTDAHQWGDAGSDNAPSDTAAVTLKKSIIYNESGDVSDAEYAGARDSDATIAKNALDDVTAGDGNMLDGYLSRSDIAGGMATIMQHTSDEAANEVLNSDVEACLNLTGTNTYDYTFETYIKGVKTSLTETIYAHGNNMMPYATTTPDGVDTSTLGEQKWGQTYYVLEDANGAAVLDDNGLPTVVSEEPTDGSAYHKLSCADMTGVPINTVEGKAIWDMLVNETTIDEAIEIQGNSGWNVSAVESVGKSAQKCQDGPGEPANGTCAGATWFPCAVTIAATWNTALAYAEGLSYGHQEVLFGVGCAYAPAMNTHRSPFGGRNFEYYSEDGFIAGQIGGNVVSGIQSTGTNVFIKHFALNDGDTNRGGNTTWANEQAIREIYLLPYEISCKEYGANGIMGSLNRIGMSWKHYGVYTTIIRKEWGWQGYLITDGDGSDGDVYNTPQAMLSVEGSMLNRGIYINAASTQAAYGDATSTSYGQYSLHQVMLHCLFQYAGKGIIGATTEASSSIPVGAIILGSVGGVVVIILAAIIIVRVRKKKKAA
ncbi:MAG TPA: glycoside hydrolase family 3 protein [Mobilitalea sp.]|nr:glycoside hydrolase family 3 protein [Mobilitalea sp.]